MSRNANLEITRRITEAINAREVPQDVLGSEFRIDNVSTAVTDNRYHGVEGFRAWIRDMFDVLEDDARYHAEPVEVGDDYVVASLSIVGTGASSGVAVSLRWYGTMWVRDGLVTRVAGYASREEALRAVGQGDRRA